MRKNGKLSPYMRNAIAAVCAIAIGIILWLVLVEPNEENTDTTPSEVTSEEDKNNDGADEPEKTETEAETETETETETEAAEFEDTTLVFAGDVCYQSTFRNNYGSGGITNVVSEDLLAEMTNADITMINQEFPFSTRGTPMPDKQYTFRADPSYVDSFHEMGVDIVALANNHILDYGDDALYDTFTTLDEAGILYAGAGDSIERAAELQIIEVNGKKFGFLAASRVIPVVEWNIQNHTPGVLATYDPTLLIQAIEEAESQCDVLTVYVHWGVERQEDAVQYQRDLATAYVEGGADVIIGSHPHILQGVEYIEGKPVFYSLGNFISTPTKDKTMLVKLTVTADDEVTAQIVPAKTENGVTRKMDELEQQLLNDYMESISYGVTIDGNGVISY